MALFWSTEKGSGPFSFELGIMGKYDEMKKDFSDLQISVDAYAKKPIRILN